MKKTALLFLILGGMLAQGSDNLLKNGSFEEGKLHWSNISPVKGKGINGSAAVRYARSNPGAGCYTCRQKIVLEPGCSYEFGAWIKTEGTIKYTNKPGFIVIISRFDVKTNRQLSSYGFHTALNAPEWELFAGVMTAPKGNFRYDISFYLEPGSAGTVWIDDIFLRKRKIDGMRDPKDPGNMVQNPHFDYGSHGYWGAAEIVNKQGVNGSKALKLTRSKAKNQKGFSSIRQILKLEPNTKYAFGGMVRCEGTLEKQPKAVRLTLEARRAKDRQFHTLIDAKAGKKDPKTGFISYSGVFKTFPGVKGDFNTELTIYLNKGVYGTAYLDDLYVRKITPGRTEPNGKIAMVYPTVSTLPEKGIKADFVLSHPLKNNTKVRWSLVDGNGKVRASGTGKGSGYKMQVTFGKLPIGQYTMKFTMPASWGIAEVFPVRVAGKEKFSGTYCSIDRRGRTLINGKPFMPLGFYTGRITQKDVDILGSSPFNAIMSYWSAFFNLKGLNVPDGDYFQNIIETMDALQKKNIKVIFSVKDFYDFPTFENKHGLTEWNGIKGPENIVRAIVKRIKHHPALMAWYICDEVEQQYEEHIISRRRLLNMIDPQHPTWSVHVKGQNFPFLISWQDINGFDSYPVKFKGPANMKDITDWSKDARNYFSTSQGTVCWGVPQIFNWAIYHDVRNGYKNFHKYRYPTSHEMLAFAVSMAIQGVKGFIYFNYTDLYRGPEKKTQFRDRWPDILKAANKLKSLEPFIISDKDSKPLSLTNATGRVTARVLYSDAGKPCILLAADGPGDAKAEFTFTPGMKSECGHTVEYAKGKYRFTGKDICCDILR